jgi:hypothetical protein
MAAKKEKLAADVASALIDKRIESLPDWRGDFLAKARKLIHEADPDVEEEWKWMGTPVFSHFGVVCTAEHYRQWVKFTFHKGAFLPDPKQLFNASLEGNQRRAIDLREGDKLDPAAFKALFRAAVAFNREHPAGKRKS